MRFSAISEGIVNALEGFFLRYGRLVSTHPWKSILLCVLVMALSSIGFNWYHKETEGLKLWMPQDLELVQNSKWLQENFPRDTRINNVLVASREENILTPNGLLQILELHQRIVNIELADNRTWSGENRICAEMLVPKTSKHPSWFPPSNWFSGSATCSGQLEPKPDKNFVNCDNPLHPNFDPSVCMEPDEMCAIMDTMLEPACIESSVLLVWGYDKAVYEKLTEEQILKDVNKEGLMSYDGSRPLSLSEMLDLRKDDDGKIVGAAASLMSYLGRVDPDADPGDVEESSYGHPVDKYNLEFETKLIELINNYYDNEDEDEDKEEEKLVLYVDAQRSLQDVSEASIEQDALFMPVGFALVLTYVMIMIGKFGCVENRIALTLAGVAAIVMTIPVCYGLCSMLGFPITPMHNCIPFMLLGIGIDDMFVIMQCFDNNAIHNRHWTVSEAVGRAMKHAGAAITVTSITDFTVFAVGATASLPALISFCIYCSVGILSTYFFQATFFVAFLSLNERRQRSNRNAILCCFKHNIGDDKDDREKIVRKPISVRIFGKIASIITKPIGKAIVLTFTLLLLGAGILGLTKLRVESNIEWFFPQDSYLIKYYDALDTHFPTLSFSATVFVRDVDYRTELDGVRSLVEALRNQTDVVQSVDAWYDNYQIYANHHWGIKQQCGEAVPEFVMDEPTFGNLTSLFLFSQLGIRYRSNFFFDQPLLCNQSYPTPPKIELTSFNFRHQAFEGDNDHVKAYDKIKELMADSTLSQKPFASAIDYGNWEIDAIIQYELYRNVAISSVLIFAMTSVLLADLVGSLYVMLGVIMTLVDVLGFMHFWGLTIDIVSSIVVIISIGLCVDYSSHIVHTFLTLTGSRDQRAADTMANIGPAVFNGGFSTFLALSVLGFSGSHVFKSFFRIFFLVVCFGLFHGLVFMIVLLSLAGPKPYHGGKGMQDDDDEDNGNDMHVFSISKKKNREDESDLKGTRL